MSSKNHSGRTFTRCPREGSFLIHAATTVNVIDGANQVYSCMTCKSHGRQFFFFLMTGLGPKPCTLIEGTRKEKGARVREWTTRLLDTRDEFQQERAYMGDRLSVAKRDIRVLRREDTRGGNRTLVFG